ncbi:MULTISPECIES: FlgB family protein [Tritonibacter]|uniref:Flagellar basal-body rod protein FlgB n=1 Tax=Tritonibacter scottomollicae TaxID=483013 RepID=A0A2T1ALJ3_TRISK|nr:FlgB family protein [Tritonibacter scottomollicae]PRZ49476.1 flagellar basal-body rod protein FlgB [Tritonibacter scottomollicae]WOI32399.1 FlgB family protein [Tritonibacter scottomollicae]
MFERLNVFNVAFSMATHAGKRQALISENIANADTPGYHAKDIKPFKEVFAAGEAQGDMIATRGSHINGADGSGFDWAVTTNDSSVDPNNNSVSIEEQILNGVEAKRQHDRALAIYRSSMNILRASLGRS